MIAVAPPHFICSAVALLVVLTLIFVWELLAEFLVKVWRILDAGWSMPFLCFSISKLLSSYTNLTYFSLAVVSLDVPMNPNAEYL